MRENRGVDQVEYRTLRVPASTEAIHRDVAHRFGWVSDGTVPHRLRDHVVFRMFRQAGNRHVEVLGALELDCALALHRIDELQEGHRRRPLLLGVVIGLIGLAMLTVAAIGFATGDAISGIFGVVFTAIVWGLNPWASCFYGKLLAAELGAALELEMELVRSLVASAARIGGGDASRPGW